MNKQEKAELLQQGLWARCFREGCLNPAVLNKIGSFCSIRCFAIATKPKRISRLKQYITEDPDRWARIHIASDAQKTKISKSMKERYKDHGPRKFESANEFIVASKTSTLGRDHAKAIRSGLVYLSKKGQFTFSKGGKFKSKRYKKGEIPARNEWDLKAFRSLDENPEIETWKYLGLALPYGKSKHVLVDFDVKYHDGSTKYILLRPEGISLDKLKIMHFLDDYCFREKISFEIWTKEYFSTW